MDPRTTRMAACTPLAMSARGGLLVPPRAAAHTATGRAHPVVAPAVGTRIARAAAARAAEAPAESTEDALEDVRERDPADRGRALRPRAPRASRRAMLAAPPALSLGLGPVLGAVSLGQPAPARGAAAPGRRAAFARGAAAAVLSRRDRERCATRRGTTASRPPTAPRSAWTVCCLSRRRRRNSRWRARPRLWTRASRP